MTITSRFLLPLLLVSCGLVRASTPSRAANQNAAAYDYKGDELVRNHQTEKAIQYYTNAIQANPTVWNPYEHRAEAYVKMGQWAKAVDDCNAALRIKPTLVDAFILRAYALYFLGRDVECLSDVAVVIKSRPSNDYLGTMLTIRKAIYNGPLQASPEIVHATLEQLNHAVDRAGGAKKRAIALNNRAWVFCTSPVKALRNGDHALQDAVEACDLSHWTSPRYIDTLAAAYAEKGDFPKAIHAQQQALALPGVGPDDIKEYRQRLSEYERHQPHRKKPTDRR